MRMATILDVQTARALGVPDAVADVVLPHGMPGEALASIVPGNPLSETWTCPLDLPGEKLITWSGSMGEELFADEPRTWMGGGHERFEGFCDDVREPLRQARRTLCFRPHARHVLSDAQGTLDFLRRREDEPFGLAIAPVDLLLPEMVGDAEDHFTRILDFMIPRADFVLLADAHPDDSGEAMTPCPLGQGILPATALMEAINTRLPDESWVVTAPADMPTAISWRHGDLDSPA